MIAGLAKKIDVVAKKIGVAEILIAVPGLTIEEK